MSACDVYFPLVRWPFAWVFGIRAGKRPTRRGRGSRDGELATQLAMALRLTRRAFEAAQQELRSIEARAADVRRFCTAERSGVSEACEAEIAGLTCLQRRLKHSYVRWPE